MNQGTLERVGLGISSERMTIWFEGKGRRGAPPAGANLEGFGWRERTLGK